MSGGFWPWGLKIGGGSGGSCGMSSCPKWDIAFGIEWNHSFTSCWDTSFE